MNARLITPVRQLQGGIEVAEHKQLSLHQLLSNPPLPSRLLLPLNGATLAVELDQTVLKGDRLDDGRANPALHAPSSGTLAGVEMLPQAHPSGRSDATLVLVPDGEDRWRERTPWPQRTAGRSREQIFERIAAAGLAGLGGAVFPTSIKLDGKPPRVLLLNGAECEPYITADHALMRERAREIIDGAELARKILAIPRCILGVEDNKADAIEALTVSAADTDIEICVIPTCYPSGGERQLVQIVLGLEVPSGGLPIDIGVLCLNVGTCAAIERALIRDEPLISRITTLTGTALARPGNAEVLIGTPIRELLDWAGLDEKRLDTLLVGGPMMGFALTSPDAPVTKGTNCLLAASAQELPPAPEPQPCIRCGLCVDACPAGLLPQELFWYAQSESHSRMERLGLFDCIECGACAWVCPSDIPLVEYYRNAKGAIRARREAEGVGDISRARFEARNERVARLKREREQQRQQRAQRRTQMHDAVREAADRTLTHDERERARIEMAVTKAETRQRELVQKIAAVPDPGVRDELSRLEVQLANLRERLDRTPTGGEQ